jgi:hypothetical protein
VDRLARTQLDPKEREKESLFNIILLKSFFDFRPDAWHVAGMQRAQMKSLKFDDPGDSR